MENNLVNKINARHCKRVDDRIFETTGVNSRLLGYHNGELCLFINIPLSWTKSTRETALKWALIWRNQNPELQDCNKVVALIALIAPSMHPSIKGGVVASVEIKERLWFSDNASRNYTSLLPQELLLALRKHIAVSLN